MIRNEYERSVGRDAGQCTFVDLNADVEFLQGRPHDFFQRDVAAEDFAGCFLEAALSGKMFEDADELAFEPRIIGLCIGKQGGF